MTIEPEAARAELGHRELSEVLRGDPESRGRVVLGHGSPNAEGK